MAPQTRPLTDLTPERTGKGDTLAVSDNITLVRAARPVVQKDPPSKKSVERGRTSI